MSKSTFANDKDLAYLVIETALKHVAFDGWSNTIIKRVCVEHELTTDSLLLLFPRGVIDIAVAFHSRDDSAFIRSFKKFNQSRKTVRIRDQINDAINLRLKVAAQNKEAVKRSVALFSNPKYFSDGSRAIWNTADSIWNAIGDNTQDINWYSKRAILASVFLSALVIWIDDDSPNHNETKEFISRRISDVMIFEKVKKKIKGLPYIGEVIERFEKTPIRNFEWKSNFPGWQSRN